MAGSAGLNTLRFDEIELDEIAGLMLATNYRQKSTSVITGEIF